MNAGALLNTDMPEAQTRSPKFELLLLTLLLALLTQAALAHPAPRPGKASAEPTRNAPLPPGVTLTGGSRAEREVIERAFASKLRGLTLPGHCLAIAIKSESELQRRVRAEDDDAERPSGSNTSDIDGIYDDAAAPPPDAAGGPSADASCATITLLAGEAPEALLQTFLHEYGHHVWSQLAAEDISAFQKLYSDARRAQSFVSDYASVSPEEDFAESFAAYELRPQLLWQRDSSTARFIAERLQRLRDAASLQTAKARR